MRLVGYLKRNSLDCPHPCRAPCVNGNMQPRSHVSNVMPVICFSNKPAESSRSSARVWNCFLPSYNLRSLFYTVHWRAVEVGDRDDVREVGLNLASSQEYEPQIFR